MKNNFETCPYCGSTDVHLKVYDGTYDFWLCKSCEATFKVHEDVGTPIRTNEENI